MNEDRYEIRLAGEGGQGIALAGLVLAEALALHEGKGVVMTQSYGAEQRGGESRVDIVVGEGSTDYPGVLEADLLVAMSQEAYDLRAQQMKPDALLLLDSGSVEHVNEHQKGEVVRVPLTQAARRATGDPVTAAVLSLGVVSSLTGIVSPESLEEAMQTRVPRDALRMSRDALHAGVRLGKSLCARAEKA